MDTAAWVANFLSLSILIATVYYLQKSIKQVRDQLAMAREERIISQKDNFCAIWSKLDEFLLEYPELTEMWLENDTLQAIIKKCPDSNERIKFFRQRALASHIMSTYFRGFKMRREVKEALGGEEFEELEFSNPMLRNMWYEGAIRDDFAMFPDYVNFVEKVLFKKTQPTS